MAKRKTARLARNRSRGAAAKRKRTGPTRKAPRAPERPLFERVIFSGVGRIEKRGKAKVLAIYTSREDAIKRNVSREIAEELFPIAAAAAGCSENWGIFGGSMSCDSVFCTGTCWVQVNKYDGLGWRNESTGSVVINSNWAYRCTCI